MKFISWGIIASMAIIGNCSTIEDLTKSQLANVDTSRVSSSIKDATDDCGVDPVCKERKEIEAHNNALVKKGTFYDPMGEKIQTGDKIDFLYEGRYYKATIAEVNAEPDRRGKYTRIAYVTIDNWKDKWAKRYSFDMDDPKPYAAKYQSKTGTKPNEVRKAATVITSGGYNQALCQTFKKANSCLATTEANCRWDGARNVCLPK